MAEYIGFVKGWMADSEGSRRPKATGEPPKRPPRSTPDTAE
jgi:hypothetical protein